MPVEINIPLRPVSQAEFGEVAYEVVGHAFTVHNRLGRIFDESVFRSTLSHILGPRAEEEVRIRLRHAGFVKDLFLDLVVDSGCLFELKAVSQLAEGHRRQLIQYLMLTGLRHGKLINFGAEELEQKFVNCHQTGQQRRAFQVDLERWRPDAPAARHLQTIVLELLHDWGTGLERGVYEEAVIHFLGGAEFVRQPIDTLWDGRVAGQQNVALIAPDTALRITCLRREIASYENQLLRFLKNTRLKQFLWVNIVCGQVTFTCLSAGRAGASV